MHLKMITNRNNVQDNGNGKKLWTRKQKTKKEEKVEGVLPVFFGQ